VPVDRQDGPADVPRRRDQVGDNVRLSVRGPVLNERITGIFTTDDGNVHAGGTLTLFDTATAERLFAKPGQYNQIDLETAPGASPERLRLQVGTILPYGSEAVTGAELAAEQADQNAASFTVLSQVLLACAGIALFVGSFLIVNTFTMLVAQRTKELALLRAVGASRRQVTRAVLAEAALVGLVASAAGLATGIGAGAGVRALLSAADSTLPDGPLVVDPATVVASLVIGVGVTVLAAWLPARRGAKIPPVAAMSSRHTPAAGRSLAVRNTAGAVLAATGGGLVIAATTVDDGKLWLSAGAVLLLTGVFVLTPLISRPIIAAAGPVLCRFGICGRLAGENAARNPRRTAATASALTIGLTLITAPRGLAGRPGREARPPHRDQNRVGPGDASGQSGVTSPASYASTAAWTRFFTSRRLSTSLTYALTVPSTRNSRCPISALDSPAPTSASTSRSRGVSSAIRSRAADCRLIRPPLTCRITRCAIFGERNAPPPCAARTAAMSSYGSPALSRKPLAPLSNALMM
jgi:hypothetical protein